MGALQHEKRYAATKGSEGPEESGWISISLGRLVRLD